MSYIKRMKLKGFKSFANPTVLTFEHGFNTVVGANGSGKSNVFDALCFVLGRMSSKDLRTEKLGNLVFNGGKNLKPAKEAEVSIYLSNENSELLNTDLDEIKITRIVSKEGQSKYLLNNEKVTRTEIVELLRRAHIDPDGYNIILQGDIMRIVNMTPNERRELIEEISNVSGYEEKKQKSVKKLEKLDLDLKEADLLMEEKTKYIKELKSEKEQAEKYHMAKEDLRFNGLLLIKSKIIRNEKLKEKKEEDLKIKEEKYNEFKEKLDDFDEKSKAIDLEIESIEKEVEIKSHNEFIGVTNKITELESDVKSLKERKSEYKKQIEEIKSRIKGVTENIRSNKNDIANLEMEISTLTKDREKFEREVGDFDSKINKLKGGLSTDAFDKIEELETEIEEINSKKHDKNLIKQDNSIQIERLNTKIEHLEEERNRLESLSEENRDQAKKLNDYRAELKKIIIEVSNRANESSEFASKLNNLQRESNEVSEQLNKLNIKLNSSKDAMLTNRAVDMINKFKTSDSGILGTVFDLASAPDKYSSALESFAGRSLYNIVVDNDSTAVKYINHLKENRVGSATFLPLNKINAKAILDSSVLAKKGVIDYALNLIKFDKKYESIFNLIFGDLLVIERVEDAKNIGIGKYKMVTLDGDLVLKSGAMSGGFRSRKKGVGMFKDENLEKKQTELESRYMTLKSTVDHIYDQKEDCEKLLSELRHKKIDIESEVAKLEKILSIEGRDSSSVSKDIENLLSDKTVIENSLKKIDLEISGLDEKIEKLLLEKNKFKVSSGGSNNLLSDITKLEEDREIVREKLRKIISEIDNRNIRIKSVLNPEEVNLNKILKDSDESMKKINSQIDEIDSKLKSNEDELNENRLKEKELSKGYKGLIAKRDSLREDKKKLEAKYEKEFEAFDKIKEALAQIRYSINEYVTLNETLGEELEIFYTGIKTELEAEDIEESSKKLEEILDTVEKAINTRSIDIKELQNKVNNLKTRISSFGAINLKAVEIYDKLNEEFNKLLEKRETLNAEKKEVVDFIAEMDEKKKEKFMETFVQLEKHFVDIFANLSTKGKVELLVEDEKNLWESGVLIRVKLSEKNYLDIKSLSGGEKTITAVAFIFAVQEFNPASFYVFDEIDAALDIMNCEKLGKLIKKNADKAQYIVVSHSEHFIQSAQSIYGVTMDNSKISSVLSLDLKDMADYIDDEAAPVN